MSFVYDFLKAYRAQNAVRLHMPGHKGHALIPELTQASAFDITEIAGADSLFEDEGILLASEQKTASLYGAKETLYCAGGSTLCIQTMLACVTKSGDTIIAGRNAHTALLNSCVLLDLKPVWVLPQYHPGSHISGEITPESVENALKCHPEAACVYITAPDYLGCLSDVKAIAKIAHRYGKPLLCDNAHGAYLHFGKEPLHPMDLGVDMCSDSAHKTLPALTGAAYLHIGKSCGVTREQAKQVMHLFGSTSPSYLILLSLDACADYMEGDLRRDCANMEEQVSILRKALAAKGGLFEMRRAEPGKLTIDCLALGYTGAELAASMRSFTPMIEPEYVSYGEIVLMFSPMNTESDYKAAGAWIRSIVPRKAILRKAERLVLPEAVLSPREAYFLPKETVAVHESIGRIAAENRIVCPPGVPVLAAGERIDKDSVKFLQMTGILEINVVQ